MHIATLNILNGFFEAANNWVVKIIDIVTTVKIFFIIFLLSLYLQVSTTRLNYFMLSMFKIFDNELFNSFKFSLLEI